MIKNEKQLLIVALVISFLTILIVTVFFLLSSISGLIFKSILLGSFLSIINFLIGLSLIKFSVNKSDNIFLLALWGGILFRLILGLSLVLITFIFLEINTYGFIFSILFFYIFYLFIEIFYLNLGRKSQFGSER
jgi:hypothetical protein